jgi:polysaccharide export outer membrane protein
MTIKPTSILKTLALAALVLQPLTAGAQSRTTTRPATRPAPAPAPRPATQTATTTPAPVATTGTAPAPAAAGYAANVAGIRPWNEQDYRLGPGDKLRVEVYGEPQLSQTLQVRPDGKITLPLIGDVMAAGHTPLELRDGLTTSLKSVLTAPAVTVIVQDAIANQIIVSGEVASPGPQVLLGPVNIIEAIAKAGGPKEFAKQGSIYVLRKTAGGGMQRVDADYKDALHGKTMPIVLQPGDTVVVP